MRIKSVIGVMLSKKSVFGKVVSELPSVIGRISPTEGRPCPYVCFGFSFQGIWGAFKSLFIWKRWRRLANWVISSSWGFQISTQIWSFSSTDTFIFLTLFNSDPFFYTERNENIFVRWSKFWKQSKFEYIHIYAYIERYI